jgi:hypothetical protein
MWPASTGEGHPWKMFNKADQNVTRCFLGQNWLPLFQTIPFNPNLHHPFQDYTFRLKPTFSIPSYSSQAKTNFLNFNPFWSSQNPHPPLKAFAVKPKPTFPNPSYSSQAKTDFLYSRPFQAGQNWLPPIPDVRTGKNRLPWFQAVSVRLRGWLHEWYRVRFHVRFAVKCRCNLVYLRFGVRHRSATVYKGGITLRPLSFRIQSLRPGHFVPSYILSPVISFPVISSPGHFVSWSFRPVVVSSPRAESTEVHPYRERPLQNEKFHIHTLQKLLQASYYMQMTHGMSCDNGDMCDTCVKCDNCYTCVTVNIMKWETSSCDKCY